MGERLVVELEPDKMALLRRQAEAHGTDPEAEVKRLVEEALADVEGGSPSGWDVLWRIVGLAEGPPDGADRHDDYIYGPKRDGI